jgi:uncharacterized protein (TIGR03083 family)
MDAATDPRTWFADASAAVLAVVSVVPDDAWDRPGLGEWDVRELVAHTLRAWTTVRDYLGREVPPPGAPALSAAAYIAQGLTLPGVHDGVAQRARDDVGALGEDPAAVARQRADDAAALVADEPDDRLLPTLVGVMTLAEYLRTRAFELTVHGLDVVRAVGLEVPAELAACAVPALALAAEVAAERGSAVPLLAAVCGRVPLPETYTLLA